MTAFPAREGEVVIFFNVPLNEVAEVVAFGLFFGTHVDNVGGNLEDGLGAPLKDVGERTVFK